MTQAICRKPKCVSLATAADGLCPPHAAGYDKNDSGAELRCANCRGLILKDQWFQRRDNGVYHVKACKMHAEVAAELSKAPARSGTEHA